MGVWLRDGEIIFIIHKYLSRCIDKISQYHSNEISGSLSIFPFEDLFITEDFFRTIWIMDEIPSTYIKHDQLKT